MKYYSLFALTSLFGMASCQALVPGSLPPKSTQSSSPGISGAIITEQQQNQSTVQSLHPVNLPSQANASPSIVSSTSPSPILVPSSSPTSALVPMPKPTPTTIGGVTFLDGNPRNFDPTNLSFPPPSNYPPRTTPNWVWVYDEDGKYVDNVALTARLLFKKNSITPTPEPPSPVTDTKLGIIYNLICGEQYLFTAWKEGYTPSISLENIYCTSAEGENDLYFGQNSPSDTNFRQGPALSKKPKITSTDPLPWGLLNTNQIKLRFSRPMKTESVEKNIQIRARHSNDLKLSADTSSDLFTWKSVLPETSRSTGYSLNASNYHTAFETGYLVFNQNLLGFNWNDQQDQVVVSLKPGIQFPADKVSYWQYAISFIDGIESQDNYRRDIDFFQVDYDSSGDPQGYFTFFATIFSKPADTSSPKLSSAQADKDLTLSYSEVMYIPTVGFAVAGGMGDRVGTPGSQVYAPAEYPQHQGNATGRNVAANYSLTFKPTGSSSTVTSNWKALGGTAIYAPNDETHTKVLLKAPVNNHSTLTFYPAHSTVLTDSLNTTESDGTWKMRWRAIQRDGEIGDTIETDAISSTASSSASELANALESALNEANQGEWDVQVNSDALSMRYSDASGETIGWQLDEIVTTGSPRLPASLNTSMYQWASGSSFDWFQAGGTLKLEAASTIMDPAGNSIASDGRTLDINL